MQKKSAQVFLIFVVFLFLTGLLSSCNVGKARNSINTSKHFFQKPDSLFISRQLIENKVKALAQNEIKKQQAFYRKEALKCITETNETLKALVSGNLQKAKAQVQKALDHAEKTMNAFPKIKYVPVNISVNTSDLIHSMAQLNTLQTESKEAMESGFYQKASDLLGKMKSEIDIITVNMLISAYPEQLKKIKTLILRDHISEAANRLYGLLNSIEIKQIVLPLPVLRAEVLLSQATEYSDHNVPTTVNLLENAEYQLQLAESMGYGNDDNEYLSLSSQINNAIKNEQLGKKDKKQWIVLDDSIQQFMSRLFSQTKELR